MHWNAKALKAKDAELLDYVARVRERAFQTCENFLARYLGYERSETGEKVNMKRRPFERISVFFEWIFFLSGLCALILVGKDHVKRDPIDRIIIFFEWVVFFGALVGLVAMVFFMLNAAPILTKDQEQFFRWLSH